MWKGGNTIEEASSNRKNQGKKRKEHQEMKRLGFVFISVLMLAIGCLLGAGCGGGEEGGQASPTATATSGAMATQTATATPGKTPAPTLVVTPTPSPSGNSPQPFTMTDPVIGTVSPSSVPEFQWYEAEGATSYTLEVATAPTFGSTDVINQADIATNSFAPSTAVSAGVVYYWRVTAVNDFGSTVASNAPFWFSKRLSVGSQAKAVAVTRDGTVALVADGKNPGTITVVSLSTPPHIVTTIPVGNYPRCVAITPDGHRALVVNMNNISVIDLASNKVTNTVEAMSIATTLYTIAITSDGTMAVMPDLYTPAMGEIGQVLTIINLSNYSKTFIYTHNIGIDIGVGIAITPDGQKVLETTNAGGKLKIINLNTGSVVGIVTNLGVANSVAVTPDGRTALVDGADGLRCIDLSSNTVTATIDFKTGGNGWNNLAITPDGSQAVVANPFGQVAIISLAENTVLAKYPAGGEPLAVAITPDGTKALIGNYDGTLSIIPLVAK
jgi:YVTN family beta-propeller protein